MARSDGVIRPEHDFLQTRQSWEEAVFDNAAYFLTCDYSQWPVQRQQWQGFNEAVAYARARQRTCLYAVTATERSTILDRKTWPQWQARWLGRRSR
jgi:hypothetical protein